MSATRSATPTDPLGLVGQIVDGQFRVDQWVGDGGFSVVYKGFHLGLSEAVAVKCLKIPRDQPKEFIEQFTRRFRDESRIAYRLSQGNLHIVRSTTSGTLQTGDGALVPYMVLEWLEGESLAAELRRRREQRLTGRSLEDVVRDFAPAAEALAYAHAHGVVHRDVKPGNLFVARTREGTRLKVLDFGMAKILSDGDLGVSPLAKSMGRIAVFSAPYAAPEQFEPRYGTIGTWTDVYAFALVLLEVLSDKRVRSGEGLADCLMQACDPSQRATPRSMGAKSGPAIDELFSRALSINPKERPQDMGEFWGQLRNAMLRDGNNQNASAPYDSDAPPDSIDGEGDPATIVTDTTGMFDSKDDSDEPTRTVDLNATMPMNPDGSGGGAVPQDVRDFLQRQQQPTPPLGAPIVRPAAPTPAAGAPPPDRTSVPPNPFGPTVGVGVMSPFAPGAQAPAVQGGPGSEQPTLVAHAPLQGGGAPANFGATMPLQQQYPGMPGAPGPGAPTPYMPLAAAPAAMPGGMPQGMPGAPMPGAMPGGHMQNAPMPGAPMPGAPMPGAPMGMAGGAMMGGASGPMPGMPGQMPGQMPGAQGGMSGWPAGAAPQAQGAAQPGGPQSKAPAIIVGVLAGLILLGTAGYLGLQYVRARAAAKIQQAAQSADTASASVVAPVPPPPTAMPTEPVVATAAPTETAAPTATETAEAPEHPAPTAAAATAAAPTQRPTETHPTETHVAETPRPTPLPTPTPTPTPSASAKPAASAAPTEPGAFSQSEAQRSLRSMESILASCKRPDGPTGAGHVRVTFANDGTAMSSVILGAPYEGTPVGECAASRFKLAHVTKFDGPPGVVDYTFHINK